MQADHVEPGRRRRERARSGGAARRARSSSDRPRRRSRARRARQRQWREEASSRDPRVPDPVRRNGRQTFPDRIFTLCERFSPLSDWGSCSRAGRRGNVRAARARDPLRPGSRGEPRHAGLPHRPPLARREGRLHAAVVLLDTPGGLSTSMKKIYTAELEAKMPVIVYVSPDGARAASAGVWIAQAADVLAMAPTTNIGSSTPIDSSGQNLGSDLRRKVINDSVGVAHRARRRRTSGTRLAVARRAQGVEPHRAAGAAHERDRRDRPEPARAARQARRLPDEGSAASVHAAPRRRAHRLREAGVLHAPAEHADRPEPPRACSSSRASRGSASRSSIPASSSRAHSAASRS